MAKTKYLFHRLPEPLFVLLCSLAVIAAVFYPAVFQGQLIYQEDSAGSDSLDHNITRRYAAVKSLTQYGEFPLWEPKIGCGVPLFAESEAGIFHPTFLLYFLSDITLAVNITILSAILIAMLGSYAWSRCLGLTPLAAGVSALAYGLGYTFLLRTEQLNIIHVIAWLPACLALIYLSTAQAKKRYWFALVAIWTMQLLASHLQMFAICQMCCWVYIIYLIITTPQDKALQRYKLLAGFLAALGMTILLGSVQLLAIYELTPRTTRESAYPLELLQDLSPSWPMLANFINPFYPSWLHAAWNTEKLSAVPHSKMVIYVRDSFQYIGLLPILLCFNSLAAPRRRQAIGLWFLSAFFLLLALGPDYGLYYAIWRWVPFISSFRFPGRFAIPLMCALACLSALGAHNLGEWLKQRWGARCAKSVLAVLILLTCCDLGYVNSQVQGYLPPNWSTPPASFKALPTPQRIYSPYSYDAWKQDLNSHSQDDDPRQNVFWRHRSLLSPGLIPLYGGEAPDDYLGFVMGIMLTPAADRQAAIYRMFQYIHHLSAPDCAILAPKLSSWLRILGISHIVTPTPLPSGWPQAEFSSISCVNIPELPGEKVYVYSLSAPLPRIRLVPVLQSRVSADDLDLLKVLQAGTPNTMYEFASNYTDCLYEPNLAHPANIGEIQVQLSTNHRLLLTTSCGRAAHLVISNTYEENWQATVDGQPAPIRLTNLCMQSLAVPAGEHRIELRYVSPAFNLGWKISLAALALFLTLAGAALAKKPKAPRSPLASDTQGN
ncbi:MAG: YfhO family protein [bacterium]|nr:YfhO family protein [bacterium]